MKRTVFQHPELRDANDNIIQEGTYGKASPLVNSTNDGVLDYINNNLMYLYDNTMGGTGGEINTETITGKTGTITNLTVTTVKAGTVTADALNGPLTGNVTGTADKAVADGDGNNIVNTYVTKSAVQGELTNYLPLSGGTVTGDVDITGDLSVSGAIYSSDPASGENSGQVPTTAWVQKLLADALATLNSYVKIQNNAGFHNSIFRGKNLGTSLTAAQSAAIQAGTFDDMFIGDYWVIGGYNWRIGMFDPWYKVGDTNFATHHLGIIPDTILYNAQYNSTNTTEGGYVGSALYSGIGTARTTVKNAFGAAHVPTHRILLPATCTGGKYTSCAWRDEDIMLMTEVMVYGARAWGAPGNNGYSVASQDCQWPLFALSPQHRHTRQSYWLQDVASASRFACVGTSGYASTYAASNSIGVRPAFALI